MSSVAFQCRLCEEMSVRALAQSPAYRVRPSATASLISESAACLSVCASAYCVHTVKPIAVADVAPTSTATTTASSSAAAAAAAQVDEATRRIWVTFLVTYKLTGYLTVMPAN